MRYLTGIALVCLFYQNDPCVDATRGTVTASAPTVHRDRPSFEGEDEISKYLRRVKMAPNEFAPKWDVIDKSKPLRPDEVAPALEVLTKVRKVYDELFDALEEYVKKQAVRKSAGQPQKGDHPSNNGMGGIEEGEQSGFLVFDDGERIRAVPSLSQSDRTAYPWRGIELQMMPSMNGPHHKSRLRKHRFRQPQGDDSPRSIVRGRSAMAVGDKDKDAEEMRLAAVYIGPQGKRIQDMESEEKESEEKSIKDTRSQEKEEAEVQVLGEVLSRWFRPEIWGQWTKDSNLGHDGQKMTNCDGDIDPKCSHHDADRKQLKRDFGKVFGKDFGNGHPLKNGVAHLVSYESGLMPPDEYNNNNEDADAIGPVGGSNVPQGIEAIKIGQKQMEGETRDARDEIIKREGGASLKQVVA